MSKLTHVIMRVYSSFPLHKKILNFLKLLFNVSNNISHRIALAEVITERATQKTFYELLEFIS